jgi:pimeloyl-ACP methyl ester carboxylesterase
MFNPYLLDIRAIGPTDHPRCKSYLVSSTAPINVEQAPSGGSDPRPAIGQMVEFIQAQVNQGIPTIDVLIQIHGYNTDASYITWVYEQTATSITQTFPPDGSARLYLGYRWSSETMPSQLQDWLKLIQQTAMALPRSLAGLWRLSHFGGVAMLIGVIFGFLLVVSEGLRQLGVFLGFGLLFLLMMVLFVAIGTLLGLRLTNYFRDVHRAENYGVLDLIEFLRQLDRALIAAQPNGQWTYPRIRLSFVGHSMGAFVVTQAVRILSDVFDARSIATLDMGEQSSPPSGEVGHVFRLGRLVLVAPDISIENVISGRANTLRSSIRRFEEAYLFSNEGDMALRLASTVANFFSFPAATREGGYRLGTLTVRPPSHGIKAKPNAKQSEYGILNLNQKGTFSDRAQFLDYLAFAPNRSLRDRQAILWGDEAIKVSERRPIAELFTYFDCTDYQEGQFDQTTGEILLSPLLGLAEGKDSLNDRDFARLAYRAFKGKVDPHGGYLKDEATFVRQLIFGLGCYGFGGFLDWLIITSEYGTQYQQICQPNGQMLDPESHRLALLQLFSQLNADRGIQVLLSPERYAVTVLSQPPDRCGY